MTPFTAVILAAGGSTRLGRPKQLLVLGGETLIHRCVRTAEEAGAEEVLVVTGAHSDEVERAVSATGAKCIKNTNWQNGIGSSIAFGVAQVRTSRLVILLADQPMVTSEHVRELATALDGATIAATAYGEVLGAPCAFSEAEFAALKGLEGDQGARTIWKGRTDIQTVPFAAAGWDVDLEEDYQRLRTLLG